jgi:hypothetical protein
MMWACGTGDTPATPVAAKTLQNTGSCVFQRFDAHSRDLAETRTAPSRSLSWRGAESAPREARVIHRLLAGLLVLSVAGHFAPPFFGLGS